MADIDIETTISDVKLFLEKLRSELPEVFSAPAQEEQQTKDLSAAPSSGKVLYCGKLLNCSVTLNDKIKEPILVEEDGELKILINNPAENLPELVEKWTREQAKIILPKKIKETAEKMGVTFNNIVIKDQKTMWASCSSKNNLNFSYRILKTPPVVQDYLIVHELAHLIHFNHSAEFWAEVAKYVPDYKEQRKWLNANRYAVMARTDIKYIPQQGGADA